jgi:microcompartment protein CcmK/EutM
VIGVNCMMLARVVGNVWATQKNDRYEGSRIMIIRQIDLDGAESGPEMLALDSVDSGVGDTVIVVREGWSASTAATGQPGGAIDAAIIGVVDSIQHE